MNQNNGCTSKTVLVKFKKSSLLHKPFLIKWSIKGQEIRNVLKCPHGLWMSPVYTIYLVNSIGQGSKNI